LVKCRVSAATRKYWIRQHAVEKADPGAKDRSERQLLARDLRRFHRRHRRLDADHLQRQVARDLIAE
jgi:hypothetical protein